MSEDKKNAYVVEWQQTVAADDARGAAHAAFKQLQRPSSATVFTVTKVVETEEEFEEPESIDLHEEFELSFHNLQRQQLKDDAEVEKLSHEGHIQVNISVDISALIARDFESFLDYLKERILPDDSKYELENHSYRVVGTDADHNIVVAVSAYLTDTTDWNQSDEEKTKQKQEVEFESDAQSKEDAEGAEHA